jgi:hypothetical protein
MNLSLLLMLSFACTKGELPVEDSGLEADTDTDADADSDTDTDADADTDADTDTDTDADTDVENDADNDGFTTEEGDCDDSDASVYPGAEDTWYDGVDSDCAGDSDYDADGDGYDHADYGGDDCDDEAVDVHPAGSETQDLRDEDCDGFVDEDFVSLGDIIVTEIMADPVAVTDSTGEWFEVYNTSDYDLNLVGWEFTADDGDSFSVNNNFRVNAGKHRVLGVDKDSASNGGVSVDWKYNRDKFKLDNDSDSVFIQLDGATIFELQYDSSWPLVAGESLQLDSDSYSFSSASQVDYWCGATEVMTGGDAGTPREDNSWCTSVDHDGDGLSEDEGDCDDADATVNSDAAEVWDGVDNNCDGDVDNLTTADAVGDLSGDSGYAGYSAMGWRGLGVGDVDNDGSDELALGNPMAGGGSSYYAGTVQTLALSDHASSGDISDYEESLIEGSTYNYLGLTSRGFADNTGDGVVDLVVAGTDYYASYGADLAVGVFDGSSFSGDYDGNDADILLTGSGYMYSTQGIGPRVASDLDVDGDGVAEVLYGDPYSWSYSGGGGGYTYDSYAYLISTDGLSGDVALADADVVLEGDDSQDYLGNNFAHADVDGDGYDDILVSAEGDDEEASEAGSLYLMMGSSGFMSSGDASDVAEVTISGERGDVLGRGGLRLADLDDDGTIDLIAGSTQEEEVYVFYDVASLSSTDVGSADLVFDATGASFDAFGAALDVGDFDGDGSTDLAISAPDYYAPYSYYSSGGEVFVFGASTFSGKTSVKASAADLTIDGGSSTLFGMDLLATDLDGDAADDLVIAAPGDGSYGTIYFFTLQ